MDVAERALGEGREVAWFRRWPAAHSLFHLGKFAQPLWASDSSFVKWGQSNWHPSLFRRFGKMYIMCLAWDTEALAHISSSHNSQSCGFSWNYYGRQWVTYNHNWVPPLRCLTSASETKPILSTMIAVSLYEPNQFLTGKKEKNPMDGEKKRKTQWTKLPWILGNSWEKRQRFFFPLKWLFL